MEWAADLADRCAADLLVLQVVPPENLVGEGAEAAQGVEPELSELARKLAGSRGRARVVFDSDPSGAIVQVAQEEDADVVVVGNLGMSGRKEFLLGSVPNRVSHSARCTVVIVNTAADGTAPARQDTVSESGRPAAAAGERGEPAAGELLGRAARIGRVMASHGLRELRPGRPSDQDTRTRARSFRDALDELGPTFAKLGQILSTRPDLLPPAFTEELATLQDQVTPLTEAQVVLLMEQELRVPWEDVFESIEPEPLAAGTIAQVHRAILATGDRVVVKVQRPTAEGDIGQDLTLLEMFAEKASNRPAFSQVVDLPAMIEHLSASLRRELDFHNEAANIERMREVLAPFPRLDVPTVYSEFSTARLLVMEEVQGIPVRGAPEGEARSEAAHQLLESYYQQVLVDGFFHADPHPGNLMWWNDKVYFLDLGMAGEVSGEVRELLMLVLLAFSQEDTSFLARAMLLLAGEGQPRELDDKAFETDIGAIVERYRGISLHELRLGPLLQQLTEISVKHGVRLPASLALAGKAFGQMQMTAAELDPSLDPFSVAESFFLKRLTGGMRRWANPQSLFYQGEKLKVRAERFLESLEALVGARPGRNLQVDFRGIEGLENTVRLAGRRIALSLAGGAALLATAVAASSGHAAAWLTALLGAAGALLLVGLLVDLGSSRR